MKTCEQARGLSIYQHGLDVANRYRDLYEYLETGKTVYKWDIPEESLLETPVLYRVALPPKDVRTYHIFHDCGKPYCLTIDADGKKHFPNHAAESARVFRELFIENREFDATKDSGLLLMTEQLIKLDMWAHTCRGEEITEFCKHPLAPTLLLTAWAEIHANAEMFGGFESTSFKIKRKHLAKVTRRLHAYLCEQLELPK